VFLVGGKGTRLGSLTTATPKPLIEVAPGIRFLDLLIEEVARYGFTDIVLLAGHLGDQVEGQYQGRSVRQASIEVIREPVPAGTGGALLHAAGRLQRWFLLLNGDSLFDFNLRALATKTEPGALACIALRFISDASRYGSVTLRGDHVLKFQEKNKEQSAPGLVNGGVYLISKAILDYLRLPCSIEREVFPPLAAEGMIFGTRFDGYFIDMGLPETLARAARDLRGGIRRPAAFLDRDGVLNVDAGHTHHNLQWMPGAPEAVRRLNEAGHFVFVVTNQAGVARGLYSEEQVILFHRRMQDELALVGAHVDAFYYCPFHEDAANEVYRATNHPDRKPNPGMILRAMREWQVDATSSFLIGDSYSDLEAARRACIRAHLFDGSDLRMLVSKILDAWQPAKISGGVCTRLSTI
jgi:D,D-heptose 1,7-bisphosphate phosphatase